MTFSLFPTDVCDINELQDEVLQLHAIRRNHERMLHSRNMQIKSLNRELIANKQRAQKLEYKILELKGKVERLGGKI